MAAGAISIKDGNGSAQTLGTNVDLAGAQRYQVTLDNAAQTYRASGSFTPQATGAVTVITMTGSATKTVRVKRIMVGGAATALSATLFKLVKTTALGAGGTEVAATVAKLDSASAAATATVSHWTTTLKAAGTTAEGPLTTLRLFQTTVTTPTVAFAEAQTLYPEKGAAIGQAIVLRGTSQFLEVQNANAGNLAAGSVLDYMIEWEEDAS